MNVFQDNFSENYFCPALKEAVLQYMFNLNAYTLQNEIYVKNTVMSFARTLSPKHLISFKLLISVFIQTGYKLQIFAKVHW